jgi:hypothetical protein
MKPSPSRVFPSCRPRASWFFEYKFAKVKSFRTVYKVSSRCDFVGDISGASACVGDPSPPKSVPGVCSPPNGDRGDRLPKSQPLRVGGGIENGVSAIMGDAAMLAGNTGICSDGDTHRFFSGPGGRNGVAAADEATGRSSESGVGVVTRFSSVTNRFEIELFHRLLAALSHRAEQSLAITDQCCPCCWTCSKIR